MENFGKKWFSPDLAHFLMAQPHKILVQVNWMCNPFTVQISSTCTYFNLHFCSFFAEMCCNPRFLKKIGSALIWRPPDDAAPQNFSTS